MASRTTTLAQHFSTTGGGITASFHQRGQQSSSFYPFIWSRTLVWMRKNWNKCLLCINRPLNFGRRSYLKSFSHMLPDEESKKNDRAARSGDKHQLAVHIDPVRSRTGTHHKGSPSNIRSVKEQLEMMAVYKGLTRSWWWSIGQT